MKDKTDSPQQRDEDAKRQNEKQEREYRKQKEGKLKSPKKDQTDQDATEKYVNLETKRGKNLEEE